MNNARRDRPRALCPEPDNYSAAGLEAIREFADLSARPLSRDELLEVIGEADLLFVRLKTFVDASILERASRLTAIVSPTTGLNHIDLEAAARNGVEIFHLKGQVDFLKTVTSTAEHTWALLLALIRHIPSASADVTAGHWRQDVHRGHELQGKRLGILGYGRLGQIVARYGLAFGMDVYAFDRKGSEAPAGVTACSSLGGLLNVSDVLSIHVPLDDSTRSMIGEEELSLLPEGAVLLNTSRGEIVDEAALLDVLRSGRLRGAAVDVIANEGRYRESELLDYARTAANLLVTPHIAGATFEAVEKTDRFVIGKLKDWLTSA
jgi:D-3-phosphoglycerate dehydrogenase